MTYAESIAALMTELYATLIIFCVLFIFSFSTFVVCLLRKRPILMTLAFIVALLSGLVVLGVISDLQLLTSNPTLYMIERMGL